MKEVGGKREGFLLWLSGRSERYKGKRRGNSWFEVFKEAEEIRYRDRSYPWKKQGYFILPGQREDNKNSDVINKREEGGKLRASLALSFSVDWRRGCLLRVKGHVWV